VSECLSRPSVSLPLLLCGALSTGCATSAPTVIDLEPPPLMECAADPEPPPPDASADVVGVYIVDLWSAGQDCRVKLGTVRAWTQGLPSQQR